MSPWWAGGEHGEADVEHEERQGDGEAAPPIAEGHGPGVVECPLLG